MDDRPSDELEIDLVFEQVYQRLKGQARAILARLPPGATLTPTALVSEAYVKLSQARQLDLDGQRHFHALAARAMRQIIVDHARAAQARKRGGDVQRVTLDASHQSMVRTAEDLIDLDRVLDDLERLSPRQRELVELKFFAGLNIESIAPLMDISARTAWREWHRARAYLLARLDPA